MPVLDRLRCSVQCCQHGGGGCHCQQLGDVLEDTCRPSKLPLDIFAHCIGGFSRERAGVCPADILQPQQKRLERVSNAMLAKQGLAVRTNELDVVSTLLIN